MRKKYVFVTLLLLIVFVCGMLLAWICARPQERAVKKTVHIVTSFYPIYIEALNVAGGIDGVTLENMTGEQTGCLHDYQMTAEDMKLLADADVFLINGGGIESFLQDVAAQYPDLTIIDTGKVFEEESPHESEAHEEHAHEAEEHSHDHGEENAHYWMDVDRCMTQVKEMASGLAAADPEHEDLYQKNSAAYCEKLSLLKEELIKVREQTENQTVVLFHEAYEYLAESLGMEVETILDLDEERQVSAGEVSGIVRIVKDEKVPAIFAEALYGEKYGTIVKKETDVKVLYLDTLVRGSYEADAYINGMKQNLKQIREALSS